MSERVIMILGGRRLDMIGCYIHTIFSTIAWMVRFVRVDFDTDIVADVDCIDERETSSKNRDILCLVSYMNAPVIIT